MLPELWIDVAFQTLGANEKQILLDSLQALLFSEDDAKKIFEGL